MATSFSPLRYPGGKQILARVLAHLIELNGREGGIYAEPYAGGAGAALALLYTERVNELMLNDADRAVYSFWKAILDQTSKFLDLLESTPLTAAEWRRQRDIYRAPARASTLRLGFATFYLNRCNRSGIICNGGLIGGQDQTDKWKIDARFNREELRRRIERVAQYRGRIQLFNLDAIDFIKSQLNPATVAGKAFVYLDPPYFVKGSQLYLNKYGPEDHEELARFMIEKARFAWVMSYDNCPAIRELYRAVRRVRFSLGYSARDARIGKELLLFKDALAFPQSWKAEVPGRYITAADNVTIPVGG